MSRAIISIRHSNPNPGGGCLCSPHSKIVDCKPPYAVFTASEMMDPRQPNAVACVTCIEDFQAKLARQLNGGREPAPAPTPPPEPDADLRKKLDLAGELIDGIGELARGFRGL